MGRTQFTFYESFAQAIRRIKKKADRAEAYDAICNYALYGEEPNLDSLSDAAAIAFISAKPNLDASRRKSENGKRGGSVKQTGSKPEANGKQEKSASEKENEKENEIEIENECYISPLPPLQGGNKKFSPPSVEDVRAYCLERRNGIDAAAFVDFYTMKGWRVGKEPMKDWKAAVRTWERRKGENHGTVENGHQSAAGPKNPRIPAKLKSGFDYFADDAAGEDAADC